MPGRFHGIPKCSSKSEAGLADGRLRITGMYLYNTVSNCPIERNANPGEL